MRQEYQRQYAPLLLLWKGIGQFAATRPDCPVLFGAVSISQEYSQPSRDLMVAFLQTQCADWLAGFVKPRRRYRRTLRSAWQWRAAARFMRDVEQLSDPVADLEPDHKAVPVLLRQYLKLGGRTLGISVDPAFSWVVDALIMVDLRRTVPQVLNRYLGRKPPRVSGPTTVCRQQG